jgi:hypothetical protein
VIALLQTKISDDTNEHRRALEVLFIVEEGGRRPSREQTAGGQFGPIKPAALRVAASSPARQDSGHYLLRPRLLLVRMVLILRSANVIP